MPGERSELGRGAQHRYLHSPHSSSRSNPFSVAVLLCAAAQAHVCWGPLHPYLAAALKLIQCSVQLHSVTARKLQRGRQIVVCSTNWTRLKPTQNITRDTAHFFLQVVKIRSQVLRTPYSHAPRSKKPRSNPRRCFWCDEPKTTSPSGH